jgi:hypothetical protein
MGRVFRAGTNTVWAAVVAVYVLATLGLSFYWLFTESGPIGWLGRWQARTLFDGSWYPKITTLLFIVVAVFALVAVKLVIERVTGKRLTQPVTRSES